MGVRFRRSIKIAPGIRLNFNKKSFGLTVGVKGAHVTVNSKGRKTASVGLPGTGLSYTTSTSKSKASGGESSPEEDAGGNKEKEWKFAHPNYAYYKRYFVFGILFMLPAIFNLKHLTFWVVFPGVFGLLLFISGITTIRQGRKYWKEYKQAQKSEKPPWEV